MVFAANRSDAIPSRDELHVLVYSSNAATRNQVITALGTHPDRGLPPVTYTEVATGDVVVERLDAGGIDLAILDGEAAPTGGIGVAKQVKDEIDRPPPILLLVGREQDRWLADWSRAESVVVRPIDPIMFADTAISVLTTHSDFYGRLRRLANGAWSDN